MKIRIFCAAICCLLITAPTAYSKNVRHFYEDRPFVQDFSEKIPLSEELTGTKFSTNARVLARDREEMPTPEAANGVASVTAYMNESLKNDLLSDPSEPANNP